MSKPIYDLAQDDLNRRLEIIEARLNKPLILRKKRIVCWTETSEPSKIALTNLARSKGISVSKLLANLIDVYLFHLGILPASSAHMTDEKLEEIPDFSEDLFKW